MKKTNKSFKIKNILGVILLVVFTLFACESNVEEDALVSIEEEGEVVGGGDEICNAEVSFSSSIQPIINNECTRCHGGSTSPDLRTYANVSRNASNIKTQVVSRRMPQGGSLSNDQIELISCWIDNGALNN